MLWKKRYGGHTVIVKYYYKKHQLHIVYFTLKECTKMFYCLKLLKWSIIFFLIHASIIWINSHFNVWRLELLDQALRNESHLKGIPTKIITVSILKNVSLILKKYIQNTKMTHNQLLSLTIYYSLTQIVP